MLQIRGRLDLCEEALGADDRSQLRLEDLEGDLPLVLQVIREIDRRHPAFAQFALDAVTTFEGCVQTGDRIRWCHAGKMRLTPSIRESRQPVPRTPPLPTDPTDAEPQHLRRWPTPTNCWNRAPWVGSGFTGRGRCPPDPSVECGQR